MRKTDTAGYILVVAAVRIVSRSLFVLSNQIFVRAVRENEAETIQRMLAFFKNDTVFVNHRETSSLNAPLHVACKLGFYVSDGGECCVCESVLSCSVASVLICVLM